MATACATRVVADNSAHWRLGVASPRWFPPSSCGVRKDPKYQQPEARQGATSGSPCPLCGPGDDGGQGGMSERSEASSRVAISRSDGADCSLGACLLLDDGHAMGCGDMRAQDHR
jgi:hypothetical protein